MTLTANRFDEIKKFAASLHERKASSIKLEDIAKMAVMLAELAAEIERLRAPTPLPRGGHVKPVILNAQGQAVLPPPISQQLAVERRAQYDADRFEAVMGISNGVMSGKLDFDAWRVFSLRWGLSPPPGGWGNHEAIANVIHAVRLGIKAVPYIDKHFSAVYLTSRGIKLPLGVTLRGGILSGVELPDNEAGTQPLD